MSTGHEPKTCPYLDGLRSAGQGQLSLVPSTPLQPQRSVGCHGSACLLVTLWSVNDLSENDFVFIVPPSRESFLSRTTTHLYVHAKYPEHLLSDFGLPSAF